MSDIKDWDSSAANNNAAAPNGWPEGMNPSDVNDTARENMAATRRWYEDPLWTDFGYTPVFVDATNFKINGADVTADFPADLRLRIADSSTLYGAVSSSSFGAGDTTVTVVLDSGSITSSISAVASSAFKGDQAIPRSITTDLTGDVYASNGSSKVLESGTNGTDATFTGDVTGDVTGDIAINGSPVEDNVATFDGTGKLQDSGLTGAGIAPSGAVMAFAFETPPTGWLECNGNAVSRTTYGDLFTAIGTSFGYGDQSTTFNLPNLRGQFIRGWDNTDGTDPDAGSRVVSATGGVTGDNVGSYQADELESHAHNKQDYNAGAGTSFPGIQTPGGDFQSDSAGLILATGGNETRPKNVYMMYCIKT